jgi:hypothetical protein
MRVERESKKERKKKKLTLLDVNIVLRIASTSMVTYNNYTGKFPPAEVEK